VARELKIPLQPGPAIDLLAEGQVRQLDIGTLRVRRDAAEPNFFMAMVEIGFGARVVQLTHRLRYGRLRTVYRRWGDTVYAAAAVGALVSPTEQRFQVYPDNATEPRHATAAIIANTRCYAKGWSMAPNARMDDGRLDLVTRQRCSPGIILRAFHAAAHARLPSTAFSGYEQGQRFLIQSETPLTVQMDGDPMPGVKRMEIGLAPGRLRLITPQ